MTVKFTNNASSTVGTGINTSATSLTVASASAFPQLAGADDYCYLTIQGATSTTREVVKATALSSNTFTIVRAQDNTSAGTWSVGDIVELRLTSALLQDVIDQATVEGIKTNFQYIPTANQTAFDGADNSGDTMIINDAELVNVYMNGVRLVQGSDYTVSSSNNRITLSTGATTADVIDIEVFGNFTGQSGAAVAITGGAIAGTAITTGSINNTPIGATQANTVAATTLTANSVAVDNITIDGNEIDLSSGDLTLDSAGDIVLDADGGDVYFKDDGTTFLQFKHHTSTDIYSLVSDNDLKLIVRDGSSNVEALVFDAANGGKATFANDIAVVDDRGLRLGSDNDSVIYNDGSNLYIKNNTSNQDIIFQGNDDGSTGLQMLKLDASDAGAATFSGSVTAAGVTVGNSNLGSNTSHLANVTINNNAYIGSASATTALQIQTSGAAVFSNTVQGTRLGANAAPNSNYAVNALQSGSMTHAGYFQANGDDIGVEVNATASGSYSSSILYVRQQSRNSGGNLARFANSDGDKVVITTGGNVAIGVASATRGPLHVHQPTSNTDSNIHLTSAVTGSNSGDGFTISVSPGGAGDTSVALIQRQNAAMRFYTHAIERARIDNYGTLAIGTTDTHQWSVFDGRIRLGATACFASTSNSTQMLSNAYYNGAYRYIAATAASRYYQTDGGHYWDTAASGSADAAMSFAEVMRLDASGRLGLGLSNPQNYYSTDLVVGAADQGGITIAAAGTANTNYLLFADGTSGDAQYRGQIAYQHDGDKLNVVSTGIVQFMSGSSRGLKATLSADGNLNIGMPAGYNAEGKLHVYNGASGKSYAADGADQLILENSGSVAIDIRTPNADNGSILFSDQDARGSGQIIYAHNGDTMYFYTAGNLRATLSAAGLAMTQSSASDPVLTLTDAGVIDYKFLFPDTSTFQLQCHASSSKTFKLTNTAGGSFNLDVEGSSTLRGNVFCSDVIAAGSGGLALQTDDGVKRLALNDTGGIGLDSPASIRTDTTFSAKSGHATKRWGFGAGRSATSAPYYTINESNVGMYIIHGEQQWRQHSDERIKENIVDVGAVLPSLMDIRCVRYNLKSNPDNTEIGFIAQDWESAFPEVVDENSETVIESDGSIGMAHSSESTTPVKGMSYTETIPLLLKAIQEQQTLIESLTTRVAELETN